MPELPEVETVVRGLNAEVAGLKIIGVGWLSTICVCGNRDCSV